MTINYRIDYERFSHGVFVGPFYCDNFLEMSKGILIHHYSWLYGRLIIAFLWFDTRMSISKYINLYLHQNVYQTSMCIKPQLQTLVFQMYDAKIVHRIKFHQNIP